MGTNKYKVVIDNEHDVYIEATHHTIHGIYITFWLNGLAIRTIRNCHSVEVITNENAQELQV